MLLLITTTGLMILLVNKVRTTTFAPAHEILVWDKRATVGMSLYLHPYFVCSSIEGSDKSAHLLRLA